MTKLMTVLFALALACSSQPETATTSAALVSHGPLAYSSTIPEYDYADLCSGTYLTGTCERWRGDFSTGSGHIGYAITPSFAAQSIRISGTGTTATVCRGPDTGPVSAPCAVAGTSSFQMSSTGLTFRNLLSWCAEGISCSPTRVYLGETPLCPYLADQQAIAAGKPLPWPHVPDGGAWPAPAVRTDCGHAFDGSGYEQFVATDLYGHPIFIPTASGIAGECIGEDGAGHYVVMAYYC